jgi:hypothetical protein
MRSRLARLGDAMLSHILPGEQAGACIIGVGEKCKCGSPCGVSYCTQYRYACNGSCVKSTDGERC